MRKRLSLGEEYTFSRASRFHVPFPVSLIQRIEVDICAFSHFFFRNQRIEINGCILWGLKRSVAFRGLSLSNCMGLLFKPPILIIQAVTTGFVCSILMGRYATRDAWCNDGRQVRRELMCRCHSRQVNSLAGKALSSGPDQQRYECAVCRSAFKDSLNCECSPNTGFVTQLKLAFFSGQTICVCVFVGALCTCRSRFTLCAPSCVALQWNVLVKTVELLLWNVQGPSYFIHKHKHYLQYYWYSYFFFSHLSSTGGFQSCVLRVLPLVHRSAASRLQ